jgi:hypothetical protein
MAATMNKMNTSAAYSDLDARTQFVLNRVEFLKSIPDVLRDEENPVNATKIAVWRDNNYIALVVRCIMDPNEEVYDHAIWATANLLGSDDEKVRDMTRNAITDEVLQRLVQWAWQKDNQLSAPVRNGLYYLLYNLSKYPLPVVFMYKMAGPGFDTALSLNLNKDAMGDLLGAIHNIAKSCPKAVYTDYLVPALDKFPMHTSTYRSILNIVGTLAEQEEIMFSNGGKSVLLKHFADNMVFASGRCRREILWILSNLVTEFDTPTMLWNEHKNLYKQVVDIAWSELCTGVEGANNEAIGYEALFVLANFIESVNMKDEEFKRDVADDYVLESVLSTCVGHENTRIARLARETLETFDSFKPAAVRPVEPDVIDLTNETDSEIDDSATEENECLIHNRPPLFHTDEQVACCEEPVPSATDLLLGADRGHESVNVRRIVNLLVNLPVGEWAEVPADWTVTVADLTVLQHLGYVIVDGWVGINPEIYSGY